MAHAVRDISANPIHHMATIQSAVVAFFENHSITKFISYAMSTGNWSTGVTHSGYHAGSNGNTMAAAVAVKTGIIQQVTTMNAVSILSHIRRVCTPLDRVGRGSRPRQLHARATSFSVCMWLLFFFCLHRRRHGWVTHYGYPGFGRGEGL